MGKLVEVTDSYIIELESTLSKVKNLKEILNLDSGKDKQLNLLNYIKSNEGAILSGNHIGSCVRPEIADKLSFRNIILEFVYETIFVGKSKFLLGYDQRLGVDYDKAIVGIEDFHDKDKFEYGINYMGYNNGSINLSLGSINLISREFTVNYDYLDSILSHRLLDSKRIKLLKGLIYSLDKGLKELDFSCNLDMLSTEKGSYTYSPVNYTVLDTDIFVNDVMHAFYGTPDEGVVYVNDEGNIFKKKVGNTDLHFVLEDNVDDETNVTGVIISWEMTDYKENTIFDLLYNNELLYKVYIGE